MLQFMQIVPTSHYWSHMNYSRIPFEMPTPLERSQDSVNLNINKLISSPNERPPLLKGHLSGRKDGLTRGVPLYFWQLD